VPERKLFFDLADARRKIAEWKADYNHVRPHSALDTKHDGVCRFVEGRLLHCWTGARASTPALAPDPIPATLRANKNRRKSHYPWIKNGGQVILDNNPSKEQRILCLKGLSTVYVKMEKFDDAYEYNHTLIDLAPDIPIRIMQSG